MGYEPETFEAFFLQVKGRMEKGERNYGGESFSKTPAQLNNEIREEVEDVAGWAFVMWQRLVHLSQRCRLLDGELDELTRRRDRLVAEIARLEMNAQIQDSPEG